MNIFTNQHKHIRVANRTAFLLIGCIESAWAPLVPFVKKSFSLDEGQMGLLMLCSGLGSILALPLAGKLCMRLGAKMTIYVSAMLMALSLLAIGLMVNVWMIAASLMLFGMCTIIIDVSANINGIAVEKRTGEHLMSGFHGGYSLGTLIGAGVMSVLFTLGVVPLWAVIIMMAMTLVALILGCRDLLPKEELTEDHPAEKPANKKLYIPPKVIVVGLLCFFMYAAEGSVMGWAAIFVNEERGVDLNYAGYFYTAFAVAMTAMRFVGDKAVDKLGQRNVVTLGALLVALGFGLVVMFNSVVAAIVGFGLVGVGASNIVPQLVSFAGGIKGMAVHNIISLINALGYSGILVGPVVIGFVAKHFGLHTSFAAIAVFALVVAVITFGILKPKN